MDQYVAHVEKDREGKIIAVQPLEDHLMNVAGLAAKLGQPAGCSHIMLLQGVFHDLGKATNRFQQYISGNKRIRLNHSTAGAYYLSLALTEHTKTFLELDLRLAVSYQELLLYPILAHHGLFDAIGIGQNIPGKAVSRIWDRLQFSRFNTQEEYDKEIVPFFINTVEAKLQEVFHLTFDNLLIRAMTELETCMKTILLLRQHNQRDDLETKTRERKLYEGYLVRLLLSMLKTADTFDSSQWSLTQKVDLLDEDQTQAIFQSLHDKTEKRADDFSQDQAKSPLNQTRVRLSAIAQDHALTQAYGISQLSMPTGSGKTETGLRYAMTNNVTFNHCRMIYTAPFLSIVEQTAQATKKVLGDQWVLEHHSNVVNEDDLPVEDESLLDQQLYRPEAYLKDYWDTPVIVTTMVQFYNTLFSYRSTSLCRFCRLMNSTILLDEIQSVPVTHFYPFLSMLNFVAYFMKANIILCTATQPPFDRAILQYPLYLSKFPQIIPEAVVSDEGAVDLSVFERSVVYPMWSSPHDDALSDQELVDRLATELEHCQSLLCILNTKNAVRAIYDKLTLRFPQAKVIYLTTNLCPAHRLDCFQTMKQQLKEMRNRSTNATKLICVSTSLIEAGVDVDFDVVCRSLTGADSIEQAQGRCNREGLRTTKGKVYVFQLKSDASDSLALQDMKKRGEISRSLINASLSSDTGARDLDMQVLTQDFYFKYFLEHTELMKHPMQIRQPIPKQAFALELLSTNDGQLAADPNNRQLRKDHKLWQAFLTAAKNMQLIDQHTLTVLVPYKNEVLLDALRNSIDQEDYSSAKKYLKQLQRYVVNVPRGTDLAHYCSFYTPTSAGNDKLSSLGIYILREEYYDAICGLQLTESHGHDPYLF